MVGKTAAQRKAAQRAKQRASGLQRYEIWFYPYEWEKVQKYIQRNILPKRDADNQSESR
jgi:hypothetical protein